MNLDRQTGKGCRPVSVPEPLLPDRVDSALTTRTLGRTIEYVPEIDSTNVRARDLAEAGATEGTLVLAEHQTRGRGRMGRSWVSPFGENLLFSLILRPALPPVQAFSLVMVASLSLCRAIRSVTGCEARIKWPNDVYLNRKKVAGILAEFAADSDRLSYVIVGVGVNVNWFPPDLPAGSQPATSLREEAGCRVSRMDLLAAFLKQAEVLCFPDGERDVQALRREWELLSLVQDQPVRLETGQESWTGIARGIDEQGALIVRLDSGEVRRFVTGDVHLRLAP